MIQVGVFDEAIVDEEELFTSGFSSMFGLSDKTSNSNNRSFFIHRNQAFVPRLTKQCNDALLKHAGHHSVNFLPVVDHGKGNFGKGERNPLKFVENVFGFDRIAFEEIPSCRYIEK